MTFMRLTASFQQPYDTTRSARDQARREASARLQNVQSMFEVLSTAKIEEFAASIAPVTSGVYDPEDTTHEPIGS